MLQDVQDFGREIYSKYFNVFSCCIPVEEIGNFMNKAKDIQAVGVDVCREALVHLMVGCEFKHNHRNELFDHLFGGEIDNWLWFHLKLASY